MKLSPLVALWTVSSTSAFHAPSRSAGVVTILASMGTKASGEEWEAIRGLKTMKTTVKAATSGAPIVVKGDTVTVHATGIVSYHAASAQA